MSSYFRKISHGLTATVTALSLSALGSAAVAFAGQLTSVSVGLTDPRLSQSTTYSIGFTPEVATNIQEVQIQVATTPSGSITKPNNTGLAATNSVTATYNAGASSGWSVQSANNSTGLITLRNAAAVTSAAGSSWIFNVGSIVNPADGDCSDGIANSETCYLRITTFSDTGTTPVDTASASFTAVAVVTVTATIDPFLTFTISPVTSSFATYDTQLSGETATALTGTTATTIPFGSVTVGIAKYGMQSLDVRTNAKTGYSVTHKFTTAAVSGNTVLKNVTNLEDVDKFIGSAGSATWSSPAAWAAPTGTAKSVNSAWVGMRSTGVGGHTGSLVWAPPAIAADAGNVVKSSVLPDNGTTSTRTYVSYKLEANAFEPADSYSGTMVYNVTATY